MKTQITISFLILMILTITISCGRNRLKIDEKVLVKQILTEEEKLAHLETIRVQNEKLLADSLAKLPRGFRFIEQRKVNPQKPPVVIDIAESLNMITDKKLSDVASNITYIRLEPVPEQTLPRNLKFKYYLMDNYIAAVNIYGIFLYSKDGRFIRTIVRNQLTGVEYNEKRNRLIFWNDCTLIGGGTSVWGSGNNLYYNYSNNITGQNYIMELDCSQSQSVSSATFNPENKNQIIGLGQVLIDLNHGKTTPITPRNHDGMWSISPEGINERMNVFSPDRNTYIKNSRGKNMLEIQSKHGDTLTTFAKLEQVRNYTKPLMRDTDLGTQYEIRGNMFFRTDFNDTVFQVIPPNYLLPVYVLNLGKYKINKQEGVDPGVSLEGKIIPQGWAETKNYIFMTFTKDSYDCPNNRRNKSVKIYHALFSKTNHQLQIIKSDPTDYSAAILENDVDGGCHVWPLAYMTGSKGEIVLSLKGDEMKSTIKSDRFQKSTAPADKKEKLKQLANSVSDQDDILMIVQ